MNRKLKLFILSQAVIGSIFITFLPVFAYADEIPPELAPKIEECTDWQMDDNISMSDFEQRINMVDCVDYAKYSGFENIEAYANSEHPNTFPINKELPDE